MPLAHPTAHPTSPRQLRRPDGCDGYLTRREAAALLGFASEFKVRELERQGALVSVRGPMRAAFYPRPQVLALRARLARGGGEPAGDWSDADLLALLEHPAPGGRPRTALDLVMEARISIERAERVHGFWSATARPATGAEPRPSAPAAGAGTTACAGAASPRPEPGAAATGGERRSEDRLSHDGLIRKLRDPDPRVRQQAFERLREARAPRTD